MATTVDKGHGRVERRTLRVTTTRTLHPRWPGLKQAFELVRERTEKGKTTVEVAHGISSLGPERADAARLLGLTRGHWGVENGSHSVRDVTLGEDACRVRKGAAPQVLAALGNACVHRLSAVARACQPAISRAAAVRHLSDHPNEALQLLDYPALE